MAPPKFGSGRRGVIHGAAVRDLVKFTIRAAPLPSEIFQFLQDNLAVLRQMERERNSNMKDQVAEDDAEEEVDLQGELIKRPTVKLEAFWGSLAKVCEKAGGEWTSIQDRLIAFGPQRAGTCLLLESRSKHSGSMWVAMPAFVARRC